MKHKHHIIPRHMGGTDDSSNLIELTIEEHAEAHRLLFEKHGKWQDKLAWQMLSGQITTAEANRIIFSLNGKKSAQKINADPILRARATQAAKNNRKPKTQKHRQALSMAKKGRSFSDIYGDAAPKITEARRKAMLGKKQKTVSCSKCGKVGGVTAMARWHFDNCRL